MDFKYYIPTKIFFGKNCIKENSSLFKKIGKKALIVTGGKSARINGSEKDVIEALYHEEISSHIFNNIEPNPSIEMCRQGALIARKEGVDFIIAIGGGSPIDAAKAIAVLTNNDVDNDALFSGIFTNPILPVIAVPTTSGTGSEVTPYSILTDKSIKNKRSLKNDSIFPVVAFLDAAYTISMPKEITINTAIDALSHSIESYISTRTTAMSALAACESIRLIGECIPVLHDDNMAYSYREKLLYASMLGGIAIAQTGTTILHALGYPLTYYMNIDHGKANGILMAEYLKFIAPGQRERIDDILYLLKLKSLDNLQSLLYELFQSSPITDDNIYMFSQIAINASSMAFTNPKPTIKDLEKIYRNSMLK